MLRKEGTRAIHIINTRREIIKTKKDGLLEECEFDGEVVYGATNWVKF